MTCPRTPAEDLTGDLRKAWEDALSGWWDGAASTPPFLAAAGGALSQQARLCGAWQEQVDRLMVHLHLPSRQDLVRLAEIAERIDQRLLAVEDRLLAIEDRLGSGETGPATSPRRGRTARSRAAGAGSL